jgi:benzoyl-CoA reductase/2-hydroxyglutaryl-CoA dehydratase subunit BcrC/BadD/HgdB
MESVLLHPSARRLPCFFGSSTIGNSQVGKSASDQMSCDNLPSPTVGLFSAQVPRELLYALQCTPIRVFPTAGKPTAAEAYLPRNFCALTRLILASLLESGASDLDAAIFTDEDDATCRLHDVWRACVPVPVWGFVEVPHATTPLATNHYAKALTRLAADLEAHTCQSLDADGLRQAIVLYNEQRFLLACLRASDSTG